MTQKTYMTKTEAKQSIMKIRGATENISDNLITLIEGVPLPELQILAEFLYENVLKSKGQPE